MIGHFRRNSTATEKMEIAQEIFQDNL